MSIIPTENIQNKIYFIRDKKVMLDSDLAELYQVETKRLNEQVKRNIDRFPSDFMFQLSDKEWKILKSQNATSSWGGRRTLPLAFTEQGVSMLSSVLNSKRAIQVNIQIIRIFTRMRELLLSHQELLKELDIIKQKVGANTNDIELVLNYLKQFEIAKQQELTQQQRNKIGFKND